MSTTTNNDGLDVNEVDTPEELERLDNDVLASMVKPREDKPGVRGYQSTIIFAVLAVALGVLIFVVPGREVKAGIAIAMMLVLMFAKFPVAISLALPGMLGVYAIAGYRAFENVASAIPYHVVANWSLSVLPMFVLMGLLLWASGLTEKLYVAARHWLGFLPGGLGVGTNVAGTGLAAVSGSTIGTTYALARVGIPEMLRAGYDKKLAVGSVIVAGLPGQLIPPSTFLVIVAGLLEVPVGPQLIAGIMPGLLVSGLFSLMIIALAIIFPSWVGRGKKKAAAAEGADLLPKVTWADRFQSLLWVLPLAVLIFAVFGAMFSGLATATEAGAIGALGGVIICIWMKWKDNPISHVVRGLVTAVASVGAIFLMIIGANILSQLLAISGLGRLFSSMIVGLGLDRVGFLVVVMIGYIILGMFMDPLAMLLLTLPIIIPVLTTLEVPLLWFGVFAVFMSELAILTPPVGVLSYVIHGIVQDKSVNLGQEITLVDVFKSVGIMFPMTIVFAVLMILFPDIALWLPGLSSAG